ncbi:MAG: glycosyltransferase family 1 protein [Pseudomonadota bacterium]
MRIGLGITAWAKGLDRRHLDGIGVYTQNLWHSLDALGCDMHGVRFGPRAAPAPELPERHTCLRSRFKFQAACSSLTGLPFFSTGHCEKQVDVFHATDHHIPKLRRTPVIATIMDAIPLAHPEWVSKNLRLLKNFAFKRSAGWCERIITISQYSKQDIVEHFNVPPELIDIIPLGVHEAFFERSTQEQIEQVLQKHGVRRGSFVFVGTLQPRKNLCRVIEAHRRLPSSIRDEHPLLIIGKYGWGDEALPQTLHRLQHDGRCHWLEDVSDAELRPLLQSATALVYPSLYEGFGLPILEGFASNIPVISSNTTAIPEVAGDAALLIDPESVDEIADAMARLADDADMARSLVARGRDRARTFTWEQCARQTQVVYRQIAGGKQAT